MKPGAIVALLLVGSGCAQVAGTARVMPPALQKNPTAFSRPVSLRPPAPVHFLRLANGLEVAWVDDRTLGPTYDLGVIVKCGRVDDPLGSAGLTEVALHQVFSSGGGALPPEEALRAARRFAGHDLIDDGESWSSSSVLESELDDAFAWLGSVLMRPRIDEALFERLRSSALERLESTEANVDRRLRLLERTAANPNLPGLTQELDASSLRALTPTRLQAQAQRCFAPDNVALAIAGRLDEAEVLRLTGPLSRWKTAPVPPRFVAHTPATPRQVWLAPLPDASRVTVTLVGRGMPPGTLDRATAETLMAMLRARLSTELRELIGAAYTVEAAAEVGPGSGAAWVRFTTRREIAWEAALAAARLFERWFVRWPFDTQSVQKVTNQLLRLDARTSAWQHAFGAARRSLVDGRRDEEQWAAQLAAVEWQNVSAVFNAFFQPSTLQIVVAGEFDPTQPWGELGAVKAAPEPSR